MAYLSEMIGDAYKRWKPGDRILLCAKETLNKST